MSERNYPIPGYVRVNSWAGLTRHPVVVLSACRRKGKDHFKVRMLDSAFSGRSGWCLGDVRYPPAEAVRFGECPTND